MSSKLILNVHVEPGKSWKLPIDNIDLEQNDVEFIRKSAADRSGVSSECLALVFRGILLEDGKTLAAAGLRSGVTVNVIKNVKTENELPPVKTAHSVNSSVQAFKSAAKNPNYRAAIMKLRRPEVLQKIIAATPGLKQDHVALAMVQDPELLSQMCDRNTVSRAMQSHPILIEAAHAVVALVHEEATSSSDAASTPSAYSYTLDALSDEDDMESSQGSDSQSNTLDGHGITSAHLAAALAAATAQGGGPSSSTANTPSGNVITAEMFSWALGQAFAANSEGDQSNAAGVASNTPTPTPNRELNDLEATSRRLHQHLQQMHELGLADDTLNLQALQATDWNVHEAINLVFSGVMADSESENLD